MYAPPILSLLRIWWWWRRDPQLPTPTLNHAPHPKYISFMLTLPPETVSAMLRSSIQSTVSDCRILVDKHLKGRVARNITTQLTAPAVTYNTSPAQFRRNHQAAGKHHSTATPPPLVTRIMANLPTEPEFQQAYNGEFFYSLSNFFFFYLLVRRAAGERNRHRARRSLAHQLARACKPTNHSGSARLRLPPGLPATTRATQQPPPPPQNHPTYRTRTKEPR